MIGGAIDALSTNPNAIALQLGDGVEIHDTIDNKQEDSVYTRNYGIIISGGTLHAGRDLTLTMDGTLSKNDAHPFHIESEGIFINNAASEAYIGDNLHLKMDYTSPAKTSGHIYGLVSQEKKAVPYTFQLGNGANVYVSFTGKGEQAEKDALTICSLYSQYSNFQAGDGNIFTTELGTDSTAYKLFGASINNSTSEFGEKNQVNVTTGSGTQSNSIYGTMVEDSTLSFGDQSVQSVTIGADSKVSKIYGFYVANCQVKCNVFE